MISFYDFSDLSCQLFYCRFQGNSHFSGEDSEFKALSIKALSQKGFDVPLQRVQMARAASNSTQ
jgi:hypothetical protein